MNNDSRILLAHGGGGRLSWQLIREIFVPAFGDTEFDASHDGVILEMPVTRLAYTTDSFVVRPLFFPGGDIGKLAVCGTVNDLAMCGAEPLYLSAGFILEEGLEMDVLRRVVQSMAETARQARVRIVTGDTKVVERGQADQMFINTTGVGLVEHTLSIGPKQIRPGDRVILSGDIGRHGIAVMASREGLSFETTIESDCAPLNEIVYQLLMEGVEIHCLRDLTRGGIASALVEIASTSRLRIELREDLIPVSEPVAAACELLGFDPMYVANEGRFILMLPEVDVSTALQIMHHHPLGRDAIIIGEVSDTPDGLVTLRTLSGADRVVEMFTGEQLPRIC
ncbi:MAG: hydrogenase expression/formation protein HypE [Candidatus Zixiibacteriota bacterium]